MARPLISWRGPGGYTGTTPLGPPPRGEPLLAARARGAPTHRGLDAFICDGCQQQTAGAPVAYWSNMGFFAHSTNGGLRKISLEFCPACTTVIQQAIGDAPRLPRADRRGLLARLGLCR